MSSPQDQNKSTEPTPQQENANDSGSWSSWGGWGSWITTTVDSVVTTVTDSTNKLGMKMLCAYMRRNR